ncbi:hypothetical protein BD414DRAFT_499625 [Trametes punicea]|nr:hypothetical protein BD414DRAFT_499625 [Trametes punicea]
MSGHRDCEFIHLPISPNSTPLLTVQPTLHISISTRKSLSKSGACGEHQVTETSSPATHLEDPDYPSINTSLLSHFTFAHKLLMNKWIFSAAVNGTSALTLIGERQQDIIAENNSKTSWPAAEISKCTHFVVKDETSETSEAIETRTDQGAQTNKSHTSDITNHPGGIVEGEITSDGSEEASQRSSRGPAYQKHDKRQAIVVTPRSSGCTVNVVKQTCIASALPWLWLNLKSTDSPETMEQWLGETAGVVFGRLRWFGQVRGQQRLAQAGFQGQRSSG